MSKPGHWFRADTPGRSLRQPKNPLSGTDFQFKTLRGNKGADGGNKLKKEHSDKKKLAPVKSFSAAGCKAVL